MSNFKILSLDGGGMRGFYTATLLDHLSKLINPTFKTEIPDIGKSFDLICGTSTGAILACGLAHGIPISSIKDIYSLQGSHIFSDPMPSKNQYLKTCGWRLRNLASPSANAAKLNSALTDLFGDTTLQDIYERREIRLCIPATETSTFNPVVFKTPHLQGRNRDDTRTLVNVCMASAAAPIYLPIATQPNPLDEQSNDHFADGGLWANNPAMIGFTEALLLNQTNIDIISLGTCETPNGDPFEEKTERGIKDWTFGVGIVKLSLATQAKATTHALTLLEEAFTASSSNLSLRFLRLLETAKSPEQYSAIDLDRADDLALKTMTKLAHKDAAENHSKLLSNNLKNGVLLFDLFENMPTLSEVKL